MLQVFLALLFLLFAGSAGAQTCTHFIGASSAGSANGSSDANRMTFANWLKVGGFGSQNRVACLRGDTYTGATITVPNTIIGTSSFPVYIRATDPNDRPKFDGNGSRPVNLEGRWIILSDFWAFDGDNAVVKIHSNCQFCQVKRGVAWNADATDGNAVFDMQGSNNLMEDVMGFGRGRKIFSVATSASNNTLRRTYAYWQGGTSVSGPTSGYQIGYGQNSVRVENALCRRNNDPGVGGTSDPEGCFSGFRTDNTRVEGLIAYNLDGDSFHGVAQVELTNDAGSGAPINSNDNFVANGFAAFVPSSLSSVKPLEFDSNGSYPAGSNNVVSNAYGIGGTTSTLASRSWTGSINSSASTPVGFWNLAGNRFCKRIESATVTGTNLWPWPMNAEIIAAMTFAGETPIDVTAEIQTVAGTIPADCGGTTVVAPNTYYVAKTGHDTNNDCTEAKDPATPKLTIAGGLACMSAGSTLIIDAGIYAEYITTAQLISGSSVSAKTTIKASIARTVTMRPAANCTPTAGTNSVVWGQGKKWIVLDGIVFDGINCTGGSGVLFFNATSGGVASTDITIQNSEVKNANASNCITAQGGLPTGFLIKNNLIHHCGNSTGTHGIYPWGSNHVIERNEIHTTSGHCVHQFHQSSSVNHNNIVRYNYVHDCGTRGILIGSGNGNIAHHNIVRNASDGIAVFSGSPQNNQVLNNTIYLNSGSGIKVGTSTASAFNTVVKNNYLLSNTTNTVDIAAGSTGTVGGCGNNGNICNTSTTWLASVSTNRFSPVNAGLLNQGVSVGFAFNGSAPTVGALDPPRVSSQEVGLVSATKLMRTWTNNAFAPLSNITNDCTVSSSVVDATQLLAGSTNITEHDLLTAVLNGETPTTTCPQNAVQDSALIGGILNAESLPDSPPLAITNNVEAAPSSTVITQTKWSVNDAFLVAGVLSRRPTPASAVNNSLKVPLGGFFILASQIERTVAAGIAVGLQLRTSTTVNGTYVPITDLTTDDVYFYGLGGTFGLPTEGTPLTGCLSGVLTPVDGSIQRTPNAVPNINPAQDGCATLGAMLKVSLTATLGFRYFRYYNQDGTALAYTDADTPRIEIVGRMLGK